MALISYLKELDQTLFLYLNGFHNEFWDMVMLMFTRKEIWIPFYLILAYLIFRKYKLKFILVFAFIILAITLSDQFSVFVKDTVQRLRPTHDPEISDIVHNLFRKGSLYGFFSSHASNTFAVAFLTIKIFNNRLFTITILCWATVVSYSRIYLGVHYPLDVLTGIGWGFITSYIFYKLLQLIERKIAWARTPRMEDTKLSEVESVGFTIAFALIVAVIMLVVWRLQYYNFL